MEFVGRYESYPEVLRGYKRTRPISIGTTSNYDPDTLVWEAEKGGQKYAVKSKRDKKRGQNEINFLKITKKHPNIVSLVDSFKYMGDLVLVESYGGENQLPEILYNEFTYVTLNQFLNYLVDCSSALGHCHSQGIVVLDIKHRNIRITKEKATLVDFDLARKNRQLMSLLDFSIQLGDLTFPWPPESKELLLFVKPSIDLYCLSNLLDNTLGRTIDFLSMKRFMGLYYSSEEKPVKELGNPFFKYLSVAKAKNPKERPKTALEHKTRLEDLIGNPLTEKFGWYIEDISKKLREKQIKRVS